MTTPAYVLGVGLTLILFTLLANLVVVQYARGVVRAALDEGVRQGARVDIDPVIACEASVRAGLDDLLGGAVGRGIAFRGCAADTERVVASAGGEIQGWLPGVGDFAVDLRAQATRETSP